MKQKSLLLGLSIALLCGLAGCTEDIDFKQIAGSFDYKTSLVIPIGTAEATIDQVLDNVKSTEVLKDVENNTCYMHFEDSMVIEDDLARLTHGGTVDTTYSVKDDPNHPEFNTPLNDGFTLSQLLEYDFDYDELGFGDTKVQRVDSIEISNATITGTYSISGINAWGNSSVEGYISFPEIKELENTQIPISFNQANGTLNYEITTPFFVRFKPENNHVAMEIKLVGKTNGMIIGESAKVKATTCFEIVNFTKAWGFFGKDDKVTEDDKFVDIPTDLFQKTVFGQNELRFYNPLITFDFKNSFGVPLSFEVEEISALDDEGHSRSADFNGKQNYVMNLNPATQESGATSTLFTFDRENGGTHQLFQIRPQHFKYKFNVKVWKKEGVTKHYWFKPSDIKVNMTVKMPFAFDSNTQFVYTDTLEADLRQALGNDTLPDYTNIEILKIGFDYTNGLPCKADTKAEFLDANGKIICTRDIVMDAGETNDAGLVNKATAGSFAIEFEGKDIPVIMNTKNILLTSRLQANPTSKRMDFRLDDKLTIKVYAFVVGGVKDLELSTIK